MLQYEPKRIVIISVMFTCQVIYKNGEKCLYQLTDLNAIRLGIIFSLGLFVYAVLCACLECVCMVVTFMEHDF